jgi:hypothetical protein
LRTKLRKGKLAIKQKYASIIAGYCFVRLHIRSFPWDGPHEHHLAQFMTGSSERAEKLSTRIMPLGLQQETIVLFEI